MLSAPLRSTISANSYSNILFQGSCTKSETNLDKNLSSTKFNGIAYSGKTAQLNITNLI